MSRRVAEMNVGVIGLGAIGPLHINALVRAGQNVRALCDLEPEKCARINRTFALSAAVYTDYREMLEKEHLDAVHICTPHYLHAEMICEALKRGTFHHRAGGEKGKRTARRLFSEPFQPLCAVCKRSAQRAIHPLGLGKSRLGT